VARRLRSHGRTVPVGRARMWKKTVRKQVVLPPSRLPAVLWWVGGLLLLLGLLGGLALLARRYVSP